MPPKRKSQRKSIAEQSHYIYKGLYEWYLNQDLSLGNALKKRSHFCLLTFIQKYINSNLLAHSEDSTSVALSDWYKRDMKCNSSSFIVLFNNYFEETVESSHTRGAYYSGGYKLRIDALEAIYGYIFPSSEFHIPLEYVEISASDYHDKTLYSTRNGIVDTKNRALEIEGLGRRQADRLTVIVKKVLRPTTVSYDKAYKTDFRIPTGYYKKHIVINSGYLIDLIVHRRRDLKVLMDYRMMLNKHSIYPYSVYNIGSTGRWFGTTKINEQSYGVLFNYQGMKKVYRKDIFHGMYEYDIATAAPSILYQMYQEDCEVPLVSIQNYIDNKTIMRRQWAELLMEEPIKAEEYDTSLSEAEITEEKSKARIDIVKAVLTSLFFGAQITEPRHISEQVQRTITKNQLRILHRDEVFSTLVTETTALFKKLAVNQLHFIPNQKILSVENASGAVKEFTREEKNKAIAHLYQGIEASFLKAFSDTYSDAITLYIHDAIISTVRLDPTELARIVHGVSGYIVNFEEELIE